MNILDDEGALALEFTRHYTGLAMQHLQKAAHGSQVDPRAAGAMAASLAIFKDVRDDATAIISLYDRILQDKDNPLHDEVHNFVYTRALEIAEIALCALLGLEVADYRTFAKEVGRVGVTAEDLAKNYSEELGKVLRHIGSAVQQENPYVRGWLRTFEQTGSPATCLYECLANGLQELPDNAPTHRVACLLAWGVRWVATAGDYLAENAGASLYLAQFAMGRVAFDEIRNHLPHLTITTLN